MTKKSIFFTISSFVSVGLYAQTLDSAHYIMWVDSIVKLTDAKKTFRVSISDVRKMTASGKEFPNDAFTEYFYYDTNSNSLLKVFYDPLKKGKFTSTYYVSNDSLVFVRTKLKIKKSNKINKYYFNNNEILKKVESAYFIDLNYFLTRWTRMLIEHKSTTHNNGLSAIKRE